MTFASWFPWKRGGRSLPGHRVERSDEAKKGLNSHADAGFRVRHLDCVPKLLRISIGCPVCGRTALAELQVPTGTGTSGQLGGRASKCQECGQCSLQVDFSDEGKECVTRFAVTVAGAVAGAKVRTARLRLNVVAASPR